MVLADSNFLLALVLDRHPFHAVVRSWLGKQPPAKTIVLCRATQQSFLRLLTTKAVMEPYGVAAMTNRAAWSLHEQILAESSFEWAKEPAGLDAQWKKWSRGDRSSPKLWMDAYLAAFAMTGGYELVTTDSAFRQFTGLKAVILSKSS